MNNIITNKTETVTSMEVSDMIGKEHAKLLRDIRRYIKQLGEAKIGFTDFFQESCYTDTKSEIRPCFNITRKGCEFIAHKLTGTKGTVFTARYVNKFHELEENNISNSLINTLNTMVQTIFDMKDSFENRLSQVESQLFTLLQ